MTKLGRLTYFLWAAALMAGAAAAVIVFRPETADVVEPLAIPENYQQEAGSVSDSAGGESFDAYEKVFLARNFFDLSVEAGAGAVNGAGIPGELTALIDFAEKYQVVGLLVDQSPQAALRERQTRQTVFVSVGDSIDGAVVDRITAEKIFLRFNGREMELGP